MLFILEPRSWTIGDLGSSMKVARKILEFFYPRSPHCKTTSHTKHKYCICIAPPLSEDILNEWSLCHSSIRDGSKQYELQAKLRYVRNFSVILRIDPLLYLSAAVLPSYAWSRYIFLQRHATSDPNCRRRHVLRNRR